jgi:hypothetical protein
MHGTEIISLAGSRLNYLWSKNNGVFNSLTLLYTAGKITYLISCSPALLWKVSFINRLSPKIKNKKDILRLKEWLALK